MADLGLVEAGRESCCLGNSGVRTCNTAPPAGKGFLPVVGRHLLLGVRLVSSATLWSGYKVAFRRSVGA